MAMIGASHRHGDLRYCTATTVVSGQGTVYVGGKLWAVQGDENSHGAGQLNGSYGDGSVKVNGVKVSVVGDTAQPDDALHPVPPTAPIGGSGSVYAYKGRTGSGS